MNRESIKLGPSTGRSEDQQRTGAKYLISEKLVATENGRRQAMRNAAEDAAAKLDLVITDLHCVARHEGGQWWELVYYGVRPDRTIPAGTDETGVSYYYGR